MSTLLLKVNLRASQAHKVTMYIENPQRLSRLTSLLAQPSLQHVQTSPRHCKPTIA